MDLPEPDPLFLPPDDASSLYANTVEVWSTRHDVVVDLHTLGPVDPEEGLRVATGIARVRLPRSIIMDMLVDLNRALGPLDPPGEADAA